MQTNHIGRWKPLGFVTHLFESYKVVLKIWLGKYLTQTADVSVL